MVSKWLPASISDQLVHLHEYWSFCLMSVVVNITRDNETLASSKLLVVIHKELNNLLQIKQSDAPTWVADVHLLT